MTERIPSTTSEPVDGVPEAPGESLVSHAVLPQEIWDKIFEEFDIKEPTDVKALVSCLRVSKGFFENAAARLCRKINFPSYDFPHQCRRDISGGGWPRRIESIPAIADPSRMTHLPSSTMLRMYAHVRVGIIEKHHDYKEPCLSHHLPKVKMFIASAQQESDWNGRSAVRDSLNVGHTVRLMAQLSCGWGTFHPRPLPVEEVKTLVFELSTRAINTSTISISAYELEVLPLVCQPNRLVFTYTPQHRKGGGMREENLERMGMSEIRRPEHGPRPCLDMFHWMAVACLQASKTCEIYIVAADQGALRYSGLQRYDSDIPKLARLSYRYAGYHGAPPPLTEEAKAHPTALAIYDLAGNLVNSLTHQPIPVEDTEATEQAIKSKVEVIKRTLLEWIDDCIEPKPKPSMSARERLRTLAHRGCVRRNDDIEAREQKVRDDKRDAMQLAHVRKIVTGGLGAPLSEAKKEALKISVKNRIKMLTLHEFHLMQGDLRRLLLPRSYPLNLQ
jgi:hypothetical protein